jgi:hypothetical protein
MVDITVKGPPGGRGCGSGVGGGPAPIPGRVVCCRPAPVPGVDLTMGDGPGGGEQAVRGWGRSCVAHPCEPAEVPRSPRTPDSIGSDPRRTFGRVREVRGTPSRAATKVTSTAGRSRSTSTAPRATPKPNYPPASDPAPTPPKKASTELSSSTPALPDHQLTHKVRP